MLGLVVRRLVSVIPMLLIVSFLIFGLTYLVPGDAATTLAGGVDAQPESIERIRTQLGLDDPFFVQYGRWLGDAVRLDFGNSLYSDDPVMDDLRNHLGVTLGLAVLVFAVTLVLALTIGIAGGLRPGSWLDRGLLVTSSVSISVPAFWAAMLLVLVFAVNLDWVPPFGFVPFGESPTEWFKHLIAPATALALAPTAVVARQLRGGLADTMQSSFIRTAWAKGGSTRQVVVGHALKNSTGPAVTVLGLQVGAILGGSVLVDRIFSLPGMGQYLLSAVSAKDVPVVQAVAVVFVLIQLTVSLVVDIVYGYLNPKVRVS